MEINNVTDICFIAPTEKLAQKARKIINTAKDNIQVYVASLDEAKDLCEDIIKRGAKIIISRKGTKGIIEHNFNVKVIGINVVLSDYIEIMNQARNINGPIGFFYYEEIADGVKTMCKLLNINAKYYRFTNDWDSEKCVLDAVKDGVKLGIGGATTEKYANKYNLKHVIAESSEESIVSAIEVAKQLLFVINEESKKEEELKIKLERYETIFNYTHDAIIAIDKMGAITVLNKAAEKIVNKSGVSSVGEDIESVLQNTRMNEVLKSGVKQVDQLMNINGTIVNTNRIPIIVDNDIKGVVSTFQDVKVIQNSEMKIRLKMYEKGLIAKYKFSDILGESKEISNAKKIAKSFAPLDSTVLVYGETGTGKELFAQSIHNSSSRKNAHFVAINCATLPRNLLESELFGYVEGAFTGANKRGKAGLFEIAHKGTIFLDEITELPIDLQGQLLRVLQEKEIHRIGSDRVTPVDIRVIAATNKPLEIEVSEKRFREDLYYRLNILNISIPPLRKRKEDVEIIGLSMFKRYCTKKYKDYEGSFIDILKSVEEYDWPGNVRELNNFVERTSALVNFHSIDEVKSIVKGKYNNSSHLVSSKFNSNPNISDDSVNLDNWEYETIINALKKNKLVVTKTALDLGMSRSTLIRKIKKYNIKI
jgi:PAS domain S-box-containing protein